MRPIWSFLSRLDWAVISGVSGVLIAVVSLYVARKSLKVADEMLTVSRQAQQDANEDWKSRNRYGIGAGADASWSEQRPRKLSRLASLIPVWLIRSATTSMTALTAM
jgi:hypothetical protein